MTSRVFSVTNKRLIGTVLLCVAVIGCSKSGLERIVVFGKVTYDGKPVEEGNIRFQPIEGTRSPVSIGSIEDGEYYVDSLGGVVVGTYQVQIRGYPPSEPGSSSLGPPRTQLLPEKYNKQSELKIKIEPGSGRIEHNFTLEP